MSEQFGGPQPPQPIPISSRIVVPESAAFDAVRRALAAIDAVHGDGDLPVLPVMRTRATMEAGAYEWDDRSGEPLRLRLSALGNHPELTVVHEIGHFLDHQGLGRPGAFASGTEALQRVMAAIRQTQAAHALTALRSRRTVLLDELGRRRREPVQQRLVEQFSSLHELFARAYAQFIARESQAPVLGAQLHALRQSRLGSMYHLQWDDADFEPVAVTLDLLLRRRRWMRSR